LTTSSGSNRRIVRAATSGTVAVDNLALQQSDRTRFAAEITAALPPKPDGFYETIASNRGLAKRLG